MNPSPFSVTAPVVLVVDEPRQLCNAGLLLRTHGIDPVEMIHDSRDLLSFLDKQPAAAVVLDLDLNMPHVSGKQLLEQITSDYPDIPVVIVNATDDIETAVSCMKLGAVDYLVKPVDTDRLVAAVRKGVELSELRAEIESLRHSVLTGELRHPEAFSKIITVSESLNGIFRYMEAVAPSHQPLLITGETGTGKELIARALHQLSGRQGKFVPVTVAGLDDNVFSDTLFGHRKGAFTGADRQREGLINTASEGTLFLDEIGDLPTTSQIKLLRLLQEGEYYPLGSDTPRLSTARIVLATNVDLEAAIDKGAFRKDLFFRLRGHRIHVPALRKRREDIVPLTRYFLRKAAGALRKEVPSVPPELFTTLRAYCFPGNVRELEGLIHDAVARHRNGILSLRSIRQAIGQSPVEPGHDRPSTAGGGPALSRLLVERFPTLKEIEQLLIDEALKRTEGNQSAAAGLLGLTRQALNKRIVRARNQKLSAS